MITESSTLNEVYNTAIGHDALAKVFLQLGVSDAIMNVIGRIKLKSLKKITKLKIAPSFYETLIELVNIEQERIYPKCSPINRTWWKEAVFYQIYPRTFCDSNGDGIGDLQGIISKLDYLKKLGVNALWLSPIYDSPNDDNGYDIRDYYKIMEEFGTMEDFDMMLEEIHARDMKLIMDLVINHTSDEHEWFKEALNNPDSPYRNYYHIRKGEDVRQGLLDRADSGEEIDYDDIMSNKIPPNNWVSFFSGSAWNYYEKQDVWALHLFSKKQMDLNWECEEMREDISDMINFWLDKGVDGFRMDVINYISKVEGLPDGDETIGELMGFKGVEKFRDYIIDWTMNYGSQCYMNIFYNNHDNPKMVSKITSDVKYVESIEKLLIIMQMTLRGTPFIYQGDEMGLTNYSFTSIDEITDVESRNYYKERIAAGDNPKDVWATILTMTREHARVLLPWNNKLPDYHANVQQQPKDNITDLYRKLIALHNEHPVFSYGEFEVLDNSQDRFVYKRSDDNEAYIIDCNLGKQCRQSYSYDGNYEVIYCSGDSAVKNELGYIYSDVLEPYEARIMRID